MKTAKHILSASMLLLLFIASPTYSAEILKVAFGDAMPPWVIPQDNTGITIDILKQTLEPEGYSIHPVYVPYARRVEAFKAGEVDATFDINEQVISKNKMKGYLSDLAYTYENIGVALKKHAYSISKISDLKNHHVISWQGAKTVIGGDYAAMAVKNKYYEEIANQMLQLRMLYGGRPVVIQLDKTIFRHLRKKLSENKNYNTEQEIDIFPLFGKNECGYFFKKKETQETFNRSYQKLKAEGTIEAIIKNYTE